MNTSETALQQKHTRQARALYMAFELGEKNWKLALGDGARSPSAIRWPRAWAVVCRSGTGRLSSTPLMEFGGRAARIGMRATVRSFSGTPQSGGQSRGSIPSFARLHEGSVIALSLTAFA